ncbi:MAG: hypothetical protein AAGG80_03825 [Pseudomonadota bacterium]
MSFRHRLTRLDELELREVVALEENDLCYYWRTRTTIKNISSDKLYSETHSLISNLKIKEKEINRLHHRQPAIEQCAHEMIALLPPEVFRQYTFIPIPASKSSKNVYPVSNLTYVLEQIKKIAYPSLDSRELITQYEPTLTNHHSSQRQSVEELARNYCIRDKFMHPIPQKIILFDDVISAGRHFKAAQNHLLQHFSEIKIIGIFIARSIDECRDI